MQETLSSAGRISGTGVARRMKSHWVSAALSFVLLLGVATAAAGPQDDAVPPPELEAVIAQLETRDDGLRRFTFRATERIYSVDPADGSRNLIGTLQTVLQRDDAAWFQEAIHERTGRRSYRILHHWSGSERTGVRYDLPDARPSGTIQPFEPPAISPDALNHLLGYRVFGAVSWVDGAPRLVPRTLPQWLSDAHSDHAQVQVARDGQFLRVQIVWNNLKHLWELDTERGHVPVRYLETFPANAEPVYVNEIVGHDLRLVDDIWVPWKIVQTARQVSGDRVLLQETIVELERFELDAPDLVRFQFPYPHGTEMVDLIHKRAFVVRQDGTEESIDLYDPATGLITRDGKTRD